MARFINDLPDFDIKPESVVPGLKALLDEGRLILEKVTSLTKPSLDEVGEPLDTISHKIACYWSPIRHLNAVMQTEELKEAHNEGEALMTQYGTELWQNEKLYALFVAFKESPIFATYNPSRKRSVENYLRNAKLSGVSLPAEAKKRFAEIRSRLSVVQTKFENNVMDAGKWKKHVTLKKETLGIPGDILALAAKNAEKEGKAGWIFTLDPATYAAVMDFADSDKLREEFYLAWVTRASDRGPTAFDFDNTKLAAEILALRHEEALLLGFKNYAELSVETKMAPDADAVMKFLLDLNARAHKSAHRDFEELKAFAKAKFVVTHLYPWDVAYYSEKLREEKYAISEKELKAYFPLERVLGGMFSVVNRLYGVNVLERKGVKTWHKDVRFYEIKDKDGTLRGQFYLDPYARSGMKRGGAWMDDCIPRMKCGDGRVHVPVAYLSCNSTEPSGGKDGLLSHDEVITLFHEFGHGLHHMLTLVDDLDVSGINGVEWDAVELPSQFMENFGWDWDLLQGMTSHVDTGEKLPRALYEKMIKAKNFHSALQMVRQMEFAIFDFTLHRDYDPAKGARILETLENVRTEVRVTPSMIYDRMPCSFTHIFSGGYAAGYYSYAWAKVLSADAFSLFEEKGIFDPATGQSFLQNVLEVGGGRPMVESFRLFRGRDPDVKALLRHSGLLAE